MKALYYGLLELKSLPLLCISWPCVSNGLCSAYGSSIIFYQPYGVSPNACVAQYSPVDSRITLADFLCPLSFPVLISSNFRWLASLKSHICHFNLLRVSYSAFLTSLLTIFQEVSSGTKLKIS